ncbi:MAG TPA: ATP-binding cassette domain-containing protein [Gammaproteobacteria bacterium]|nr:ATP-binding cassette domain-containing protein [Gammaproteobacteria bacterium]
MMHKPIRIQQLSLTFPHKTCFEDFSTEIHHGNRIAIIGRNGSGKSSLLNLLCGTIAATSGQIIIPEDVSIGYIAQVIKDFSIQSGGERVNSALTEALSLNPNILLLDEPTNHLDQRNRRNILRWLAHFSGTLLIVSHDVELLRQSVNSFWHIDQGQIQIFTGNFDDYQQARNMQRLKLETSLHALKRQQKALHHSLMQEQQRAAGSKTKGAKSIEQRKWPTIVSRAKAGRSQETSGRKKAAIFDKKQTLLAELAELNLPEIIIPKFQITTTPQNQQILSISQGAIGYSADTMLLQDIYLSITANSRVALLGDNGSGKSTLLKAIMGATFVRRSGEWSLPKLNAIGYLDQHYQTLSTTDTVLTSISGLMTNHSHIEIRRHLADFLFRSKEEVNAPISQLSGGEKARLSLAHIAAQTPELLLLDEVTNNLDLETRQHMIEVLKHYPGALIVIAHDMDFLDAIAIEDYYEIGEGRIYRR